LQLEGADAVIGCLEDVVCPADIGVIAIRIALRGIPGMVVAGAHDVCILARIVCVADHQADRRASRPIAISPSCAGLSSGSSRTTEKPGSGRPIEPSFTG